MTVVEICNQALSELGDQIITSLDEQKKSARLCKQFYEVARDKVLTEYEWSFATEYKALAKLSEEPENSVFAYQFSLPNDVLTILKVKDQPKFEVIGSRLHCDSPQCTIKYIKKIENSDIFPLAVTEAISLYLAHKMCVPMTGDKNLKDKLLQYFDFALENAMGKDGVTSLGEEDNTFWVDKIL
jgi:hypothetical protein